MKKFRQHFKIAIIAPMDGFTHTGIKFDNQVSSQETAPSWQGIQNARDNQDTENSMEFFRGKALALQTLKQITKLITDCENIVNILKGSVNSIRGSKLCFMHF